MADAQLSITAKFYRDVLLMNETSFAKGEAVFQERELVQLTFAADDSKILVFPAKEVGPNASRLAGREITYAEVYHEQYAQFLADEQQRASGTPLEEGGTFTRAEIKGLEQMHVHNYEALRDLDGHLLKKLGTRGRDLKNKAAAYLEAKPLVHETATLVQKINDKDEEIARLRAQLAEAATIIPVEPTEPEAAVGTNFDKWDDDDLKEFIREETGERPKGNPKHETLVAAAEEIRANKK